MSTLFVRTLREDPADAEVPSHRLLRARRLHPPGRAGHLLLAAAGPAGLQEGRAASSARRWTRSAPRSCTSPRCCPREPYEATGRWTEYGDGIFRLKDRKGNDYLLGPTHEEMFTLVVKDLYSSYKDLPVWLYQIQTKYRDEARPRAGLIRGREFVMKDSYSFDIDDAGLDASYAAHRAAYIKTFDRFGFDYVIVKAMSGAMGGSKSEEFLARSPRGRGHLRALHELRLRRQRRGGRTSGRPRPMPVRRRCPPPTPSRRRTPRPSTRWSTTSTRPFPRADDRPWARRRHAEERGVLGAPPRRPPEPLAIGLPGDRDVDTKRLEA